MVKKIRNSVKGIIINEGRLLVTENRDSEGTYYLLPGGGQRHGETLHEALQRECREEIGTEIEIGQLLLIREYIGRNHEFAEYDGDVHQIELMFGCEIANDYCARSGAELDGPQVGVAWLPMDSLAQFRIYPSVLKDVLAKAIKGRAPVYLGDVN